MHSMWGFPMRKTAFIICAVGSLLASASLGHAENGWKCKRPASLNWLEKFICFSEPLPGPKHEAGGGPARARDYRGDYRSGYPGGGSPGLPGGGAGNAGNAGGLGVGDSGHILARFFGDLLNPDSSRPDAP